MASYKYKARNQKGKIVFGNLEGLSKDAVLKELRKQRLSPVEVSEEKEGAFSSMFYVDAKGNIHIEFSSLPTPKDLTIFTKQLGIMLQRGVPLVQSLGVLAAQQKSRKFSKVLDRIKTLIENGSSLSDALSAFPKVFNELYISMIRAGEMSGNLDVVIFEIVKFQEKSERLRKQIKSASTYPVVSLVFALLITYGILVFLVPVFAEQYKSSDKPLPELTQIIVNLSNALTYNIHYILGTFIGIYVLISRYQKTPDGKKNIDNLMLRLPMIGDLMKKVAIGRFAATMSTMMSSGVAILDALKICGSSSGNRVVELFINNVSSKIAQGSTFSAPLSEGDLFPPMVISMVTVGEQTGALDETLTKVAEIYEEEVDTAVKNLTEMIQPFLIVFIGVLIGVVIIALYLPIFDQADLAGGGG